MNRRVIPVLLLDRRHRVVKTVRFGERTYIGDPINVVRIFNEKEVDELCVLDIDASADGREPDVDFIAKLASECFMPLTYGGGIRSLAQAQTLMRLGVEKFVIGSGATSLELIRGLADTLGSQAVAACMDVERSAARLAVKTRNGSERVSQDVVGYARRLQDAGIGEIVLQSIDRDGMRCGYDLDLVKLVSHAVTVPVVALGGAGGFDHLPAALNAGASAVASGSAFTFLGRLRGVLISYPSPEQLRSLP